MESVNKIWGKELIIENNIKYCLKFLIVNRGWMNSWHFHKYKDETFYVAEGRFYLKTMTDDIKEGILETGDKIRIVPRTFHRICGLDYYNRIIEVSTYFDDNDVTRKEVGKKLSNLEILKLLAKERYSK